MPGRRSDAERNRHALIEAFTELLGTYGAEVPMYQVARRAGLGQATLYRHFPERALLAAAVYDQRLDRLGELAAASAGDPGAFLTLLRVVVEEEARTPGMLAVLREGADGEQYLDNLADRAFALLAAPLREAQAAGLIRPDLTLADVRIVLSMTEGVIAAAPAEVRAGAAGRAFELLVHGLAGARAGR